VCVCERVRESERVSERDAMYYISSFRLFCIGHETAPISQVSVENFSISIMLFHLVLYLGLRMKDYTISFILFVIIG
jgi:hypothetical protein